MVLLSGDSGKCTEIEGKEGGCVKVLQGGDIGDQVVAEVKVGDGRGEQDEDVGDLFDVGIVWNRG